MDIGIDLGTTHSVLAVAGRVELTPGYPEGEYIAEADVTIIPAPDGARTFPSVFWVSPDDPDERLFGYDARQKTEDGDSPIMFSKRSIGTDEILRVFSYRFTAEDVAVEFLRYLKECAEAALGEPVQRAVVTHPAYFDPSQRQQTRRAAEKAGLDMALPVQLIMEPAAAAVAHLKGVRDDPVKVMTYDLGGGTFDVSVLERREGIISLLGFGGDALLGGYSFDKALVQWMLEKACAGERTIPYDPEDPVDRGRRARLLMIAEDVKIRLSETRTDRTYVSVRAPNVLVDETGRTVPIQERINREEYRALIADKLDETCDQCRQALAKAHVAPDELSCILLVGASTFGPWIRDTLTEAFPGVRIEEFYQDVSVAAGAALQARELPPTSRGQGLCVTLDVPERSPLPAINIGGRVTAENGEALDPDLQESLRVSLTLSDGTTREPLPVDGDGCFLFENAELDEDEPSELRLRILDGDGWERLVREFTVSYDEESGDRTEVYTVLPKPVMIGTARGRIALADEGVTLPVKIEEDFTRLHDGDRMDVPIYLDDRRVGSVDIANIPESAGRGATLRLVVEVTEKMEMKGRAVVLTRRGTEAARCKVHIVFPPLALPTLPELKLRFEDLEAERFDSVLNSTDPRQRTRLDTTGAKISASIERMLAEQEPDRKEIYRALAEFERIVRPLSEDMDPPRARFLSLLDECRRLLAVKDPGPQVTTDERRLERIETEGHEAYASRNHRAWERANADLARVHAGLVNRGILTPLVTPDTWIQKEYWIGQVDKVRAALVSRRSEMSARPDYETVVRLQCDEIDKRLDSMERAIDEVADDLAPEQALPRLQRATRGLPHLAKGVKHVGIDVDKENAAGPSRDRGRG